MKKLLLFLPLIFLSFYSQASATQLPTTATARDVGGIFDCAENGKSYNIASVLSCLENRFVPYKDYKTTTCYLTVNRFGGASICNITGGDYEGQTVMMNGWYGFTCPPNTEKNRENMCESNCELGINPDGTCMDACQFKQSTGDKKRLQWLAYVYGEQVTGACYGDFGATRCELSRIPNDSTLCTDVSSGEFTQNTLCHGNFQFTGNQCDGGTIFWGTNGPDEPIIPTDPTHDPDDPTGPIEDPSVLPDDSTNTFNKPDVEDEPDVEEPDTDESTDTAVVSAITGLNKDINTALHDLNSDINETQGAIVNELIAVKGSLVDNTQATQEQQINDNKIYNNTKALIQQANGDITTAVNKSTNATKGVREDLKGLGDSIGELGNSLDGIEELLKGSGFNSPHGDDVPEQIFASSDFIAINETIAEKTRSIEDYVDEIKGLVSIGTNFNNGSLSDRSFTVKGTKVDSGLQRFDDVSPYVRPVILFICALIALYILFGQRSK